MIIYKYNLGFAFGTRELEIHRHARLLSVGVQAEGIMLWALVDKTLPSETMLVTLLPTGHEWEGASLPYTEFIGTVPVGGIVFHVFIKRGHL